MVQATEITQEELTQSAAGEVEQPAGKPAASETAQSHEQDTEQEQENKGKGGFQKRIDRLTRRNYELEQRHERLMDAHEQLLNRLTTGKPAGAAEEKPNSAPQKPTPDQFKTYEEYVEALADFKADQRIEQKLRSQQESQEKQSENDRLKETFAAYNQRVQEAQGRYDDFDEVVGRSDIQIPQAVQMAVIELENGPDVAYYLGSHPEVCRELCKKSPMAAVAHLGRIAATLEADSENQDEDEAEAGAAGETAPVKPVVTKPVASSKPAPIRPVRKPAPTHTGLSDDLPIEEWMRRRNAQKK
jgi:hypothetical protein